MDIRQNLRSVVAEFPPPPRRFKLEHTFTNVSSWTKDGIDIQSPHEFHFGIECWTRITRVGQAIAVNLECTPAESEVHRPFWIITRRRCRVILQNGNEDINPGKQEVRDRHAGFGGKPDMRVLIQCDRLLELSKDDNITIQTDVEIVDRTRAPKEVHSYFNKENNPHFPVVLTVNNRNYFVEKYTLLEKSSYFYEMFCSPCIEARKERIEIFNIDHGDFEDFLLILEEAGHIHDLNVEGILHLAFFFDSRFAIKTCENYLIGQSELGGMRKFELARKYEMKVLVDESISEMTIEDVERALKEEELDRSLLKKLANRAVSISKEGRE